MDAVEKSAKEKNGKGQEGRHEQGEIDTVDQRTVTVFAVAGTEGLRDKRVEADEDAFTTEGENVEEIGADGYGADGHGAVGKAADHHGVDDAHAHPADFGEDEREGEAESGAEFGTEGGEGEHGSVERV